MLSLFLPVIAFSKNAKSARFSEAGAIVRSSLPCFPRKSPCFRPNNRETGSQPTAHTTTQSSQTTKTVVDRKEALSAGILPPIFNVRRLCRTVTVSRVDFGLRSLHRKIPFPADSIWALTSFQPVRSILDSIPAFRTAASIPGARRGAARHRSHEASDLRPLL
jgi:hypothetical protein